MKVGGLKYFYDIEHEHDQKYVDYLEDLFTKYLKRTLDSKPRVTGLDNIRKIPDEDSIVLVSVHKSQLDYVVIPWVLYQNEIFSERPRGKRPIAIAAGDNLFKTFGKWNFDELVRKAGGYKILRKPDPEKIASITKTQIRYVGDRMNAGDWFLMFAEKARSYTGLIEKFDSSAIGVFQKAAKHSTSKVVYVPTTISNERTAEDRWFRAFNKYKYSNFRFKKAVYYALDWPLIFLQQYLTQICEKPLGHISVSFGEPISGEGYKREDLAAKIETECKSMVKAYPTNIMAAALLRNQDRSKIYETIMEVQEQLKTKGAIPEILPPEEITARAARFLDAPFRRFFSRKTFKIERGDMIRYYNNCIAHFLDQT